MAETTENVHVLGELVHRFGPSTEEEVLEEVSGYEENDLIEEGARVASERISTDCARSFGQGLAFWDSTSEEVRENLLLGMSDDVWRIAIWAAYHDQELAKQVERSKEASAGKQSERRTTAEATRKRGRVLRTQLYAMFKLIIGGDVTLLDALDTASGTIGTDDELANALEGLAGMGERILTSQNPAILKRAQRSKLTKAKLEQARALAAEVRTAGSLAASTRQASPVTQGTLDKWDGICLVLYERIMDIFDAANQANREVPRLTPIALRGYFRRGRKKRTSGDGGSGGGGV